MPQENKYIDSDSLDDVDAVAHYIQQCYPEISLSDCFKIAVGVIRIEDARNRR